MIRILFLLFAGLCSAGAAAQTIPPSEIAARSWVLLDTLSGQFITGYKQDERFEPASLTKLMTAYLVFDALKQKKIKPEQVVPVPDKARKAIGSRMFIQQDIAVTVDELVRGMIIQSGNDATIALAEAVAGSEEAFAQRMNQEAKRMGLTNTEFANSTGLPAPRHSASARDLAILTAALIRDYPEQYPLYAQKEYTYNNITQQNRNRLLWRDPTVDGVKTGQTEAAGWCLIASARRDNRRLIAVVMGAASNAARAAETQKLLNYGYQFFDTVKLYDPRQAASTPRVWKGASNTVKAGFPDGLYVTVPKGQGGALKATIESQQPLLAPLRVGQTIGTLKLELNGKPLQTLPVVALEDVPVAGIVGRAWDALRLLIKWGT
ncbi:MAG: D-alanyl-D-alanine carboxypeptidase [Betaproteobacteria bacterium]|nr:D-alanyl-D-alanine carboxypeptidase [Betaproteobacteria bacterium]